ncbi:hypothetical protein SynSYN20_00746 [Synechococcus sp. SYN20]|nr:hypothetical protein SynSYN20_00746 [Synechococcus sp. SYN20]
MAKKASTQNVAMEPKNESTIQPRKDQQRHNINAKQSHP